MNILIVRTIQADLLGALINSLNEEFPPASIYIFDNQKQTIFLQNLRKICQPILLTKKKQDYSVLNVSFKTIREIRALNFDAAIIPHKQYELSGFGNVILLLAILKIKKWFHCSVDWRLRHVSKLYLLRLFWRNVCAAPVFILLAPFCLSAFFYLWFMERVIHRPHKSLLPWKCGLEDI